MSVSIYFTIVRAEHPSKEENPFQVILKMYIQYEAVVYSCIGGCLIAFGHSVQKIDHAQSDISTAKHP